ncbi:MAG: hypothetical protein U0527_04450, partial [Candidatus Eisenbacteria bacterium]
LAVAGPARAIWSSDPAQNLAIADRTGEQVVPKIACGDDGATYVAWFDNASGGYRVYLQYLDPAGNEQWPHNGLLVSDQPQSTSLVDWDLLVDQGGNAVLTFTDTRTGSDLDVYVYKIAPDGSFLWGANGIAVTNNNDFEPSPCLAEASDGDIAVVWARLPDTGDGTLRLQRYAPNGTPRFAAEGIVIASAATESPGFCQAIASDNGSVIVSYLRDIDSFTAPRHLRAVKVSSTGTILWGPVAVYDAVSFPIGYLPQLASDGANGAVLCWHRSQSNIYNSVVQRLTSAGTEVWPHNGVLVSTLAARYHINPSLAFNAATNECFVFWNEETTNQNQWGIRMQKVTAAGTRAWTDQGIALVTMSTVYRDSPRAVPVGNGAMVFFSDEPGGIFNKDRILGYRVDGAGATVWGPNLVSSVLSSKARRPLVVDATGNARMIWEDDRNGTPDVYGQAVRPDGTLGAPTTAVESPPRLALVASPNPFRAARPQSTSARRSWAPRSCACSIRTDGSRNPAGSGTHGVIWDGRRDDGSAGTGRGLLGCARPARAARAPASDLASLTSPAGGPRGRASAPREPPLRSAASRRRSRRPREVVDKPTVFPSGLSALKDVGSRTRNECHRRTSRHAEEGPTAPWANRHAEFKRGQGNRGGGPMAFRSRLARARRNANLAVRGGTDLRAGRDATERTPSMRACSQQFAALTYHQLGDGAYATGPRVQTHLPNPRWRCAWPRRCWLTARSHPPRRRDLEWCCASASSHRAD